MNIVLLSGGSGKRLWPLSNDIRSKKFIKFFKKSDGTYESMVQKIYRKIKDIDTEAVITVATSKSQVSAINNQLGEDVGISVEPCRKDTFPAIALAIAYLYDVKKVSPDEAVVICPVDPYVDDEYFYSLNKLYELAYKKQSNIVLMGIEPTYPSEKYGYIIPKDNKNVSKVKTFKEKPSEKVASEYIKEGALWNSGVFAFKIDYLLKIAHELIEFKDYYDLLAKYDTLDKISFDYAVVEKEKDISVMRFSGEWKDLGTWNTLTEAMDDRTIGNVIVDDKCINTNIINELDIPILCMGVEDVVVSASPEGILVSDKEESSRLKTYVEKIEQPVRFAEKSWGTYKVIDTSEDSMTVKLKLKAGGSMKYHSHSGRDEIWNIISGEGYSIIDGEKMNVGVGDVISIHKGQKHSLTAISELEVVEIQLGENISVDDKVKYI